MLIRSLTITYDMFEMWMTISFNRSIITTPSATTYSSYTLNGLHGRILVRIFSLMAATR